jgi:hypothetical protein
MSKSNLFTAVRHASESNDNACSALIDALRDLSAESRVDMLCELMRDDVVTLCTEKGYDEGVALFVSIEPSEATNGTLTLRAIPGDYIAEAESVVRAIRWELTRPGTGIYSRCKASGVLLKGMRAARSKKERNVSLEAKLVAFFARQGASDARAKAACKKFLAA